jgi:hypothetical protein
MRQTTFIDDTSPTLVKPRARKTDPESSRIAAETIRPVCHSQHGLIVAALRTFPACRANVGELAKRLHEQGYGSRFCGAGVDPNTAITAVALGKRTAEMARDGLLVRVNGDDGRELLTPCPVGGNPRCVWQLTAQGDAAFE